MHTDFGTTVTDPDVYTNDEYWNEYIQFFDSAGNQSFQKYLEGYGYLGKFYKARVSTVDLT